MRPLDPEELTPEELEALGRGFDQLIDVEAPRSEQEVAA